LFKETRRLRVWNEGFTTEEWWDSISDVMNRPTELEDVRKLDFDATFFAEVDGQAVGLVEIKIHEDEARIRNLVVLRNFRRRGIGTKLLEKAIEFIKSRRIRRIRVKTSTRNASRFYRKNGFGRVDYLFLIRIPHMNDAMFMREKELESMRKLKTDFEIVTKFELMIRELSP